MLAWWGAPIECLSALARMAREGSIDEAIEQYRETLKAEPDHVAALSNLDRQFVHLIVPMDSPISSFRDLAGKRIGVGPEQSGSKALGALVLQRPELVERFATWLYALQPNLWEEIRGLSSLMGIKKPSATISNQWMPR